MKAAPRMPAALLLLSVIALTGAAGFAADEKDADTAVIDVSAMLEIFETDPQTAKDLLRRNLSGGDLIAELEKLAEEKIAEQIDCVFIRTADDHLAEIKSVAEIIFGTVGDPPEIPNTVEINGRVKGKIRPSYSFPTSLNERDSGITFTVQPSHVTPIEHSTTRRRPEPGVWANRRGDREKKQPRPDVAVLMLTLDWTHFAGGESMHSRPGVTPENHPNMFRTQPRFRHAAPTGLSIPLIHGQATLISCFASPERPDRHAFVFVTAWQLPVTEAPPKPVDVE